MGLLQDLLGGVKTIATGEPSKVAPFYSGTGASNVGPVTSTGAQYPIGKQQAAPTSVLGAGLGSALGQGMNQVKYGMNTSVASDYSARRADPANANKSDAELVNEARAVYKNDNMAPVTDPNHILYQGSNGGTPIAQRISAMPNSTTESQDQGLFKPVTFRSGTGTATLTPEGMTTSLAEPYAGIGDMVGEGQGLLGKAAGLAEQAPERFNYNFDPEASAQRLFSQRSALLEPAFEQQRIQAAEQAQGMGRLGLKLSNASLGLGGDGMSQPEFAGMNAAQANALAQLSAQSTDDAFGQELQRQSAAQNTYQLNQAAQQQQLANLQGLGQGMFTSGLQAPALEASLAGIPLQTEALRQNYELGLDQNDIARMQAEAAIKNANYQPSGWLTGLTSLGSAFLGTNTGSNWLTGLFK